MRTANGNGDDRDDGAGDVPEEEEDHQRDGDDDLDQRGLQVVDGAQDQLGPVVDGDDLDARRQAGLDLLELGLDALDDVQGVLALAHDDDAGDHVARPVQVGDAAADVRAQHHLADVLDPDGRAALAGREDDLLDVLERLGVAAPAHHVLGAAELDQAAADIVVAAAHRLHHPVDRDVVGLQPVRVHVHLVLPHEAADGRHLGHAGHGLQVVAQIPVLVRAQVRQAVLAGLVDQRVLEDPAEAGGVRPQFGLHALRAGAADAVERYSSVRERAQ